MMAMQRVRSRIWEEIPSWRRLGNHEKYRNYLLFDEDAQNMIGNRYLNGFKRFYDVNDDVLW